MEREDHYTPSNCELVCRYANGEVLECKGRTNEFIPKRILARALFPSSGIRVFAIMFDFFFAVLSSRPERTKKVKKKVFWPFVFCFFSYFTQYMQGHWLCFQFLRLLCSGVSGFAAVYFVSFIRLLPSFYTGKETLVALFIEIIPPHCILLITMISRQFVLLPYIWWYDGWCLSLLI